MFPRYPPEQPRAGASADQTAHLTVRDTVFLEGDNPFAVLPVKVQAVTAAVLTAVDRQLVHHSHSSLLYFCKHTTAE